MNFKEQIRDELLQALQGDADAIDRVSERLAAATATHGETQEREEFMDAVAEFRQEYRDVVSNPDDYQACVKADAAIAKAYPQLGYRERLRIAGNCVRSGEFGEMGIDADRSLTIQEMKRSREPRPIKAVGQQPHQAAQEADDDTENSQAIAAMAQARGRVAR